MSQAAEDVVDDGELDEPEPPARVSVLAVGDDVDELAICTNVWRIYLRRSADDGFATSADVGREMQRATAHDTRERMRRRAVVRPSTGPAPVTPAEEAALAVLDASPPRAPAPRNEIAMRSSPIRDRVVECHAAFVKNNDRPPTTRELFEEVGLT